MFSNLHKIYCRELSRFFFPGSYDSWWNASSMNISHSFLNSFWYLKCKTWNKSLIVLRFICKPCCGLCQGCFLKETELFYTSSSKHKTSSSIIWRSAAPIHPRPSSPNFCIKHSLSMFTCIFLKNIENSERILVLFGVPNKTVWAKLKIFLKSIC